MKKSVSLVCFNCLGAGRVELPPGQYRDTVLRLRAHGDEITAAELARLMGVQPTAMSNRLAALERMGLATSRVYGRKRFFRATEGVTA